MRFKLRNIILVFTIAAFGFACSDSTTSPDSEQATVNGRVENNEGSNKAKGSGNQLSSAVEGAVATESEIDGMFETYNAVIVGILEQEFSANAQTIVNINTQINNTGGLKTTLESSLSASGDTDAIVEAYTTFYSGVESTVNTLFSAASESEATLVTDVMILINVAN